MSSIISTVGCGVGMNTTSGSGAVWAGLAPAVHPAPLIANSRTMSVLVMFSRLTRRRFIVSSLLIITIASSLASTIAAPALAAQAQNAPDVDLALAAVRASASSGNVVAQFSLGSVLYYSGDDVPEAVNWFRQAAN